MYICSNVVYYSMNTTQIPNEIIDDSIFEEIAIKVSDYAEAELEMITQ